MDDAFFQEMKLKKSKDYLHKGSIRNYEQVKFIYSNGEEYQFPGSNEWREDELRQTEVSNLLHKICPVVIENAEDINTASQKKEKSVVYWNMNYKGKFRRTLWFIPLVVILCFLTPLFMGKFLVDIRYTSYRNFDMAA